ncbi:sigma-70 family RNA polymerase sigma factor, partial [Streptomyces sp. SID7760]|nr:sigma-70 family RNA polymerase sigma factor [Streptomyces sp. SID7760]
MITDAHTIIHAAGVTELFLMGDDLAATVTQLQAKGAQFTTGITEQRWGSLPTPAAPGAGTVGLYQPGHDTAYDVDCPSHSHLRPLVVGLRARGRRCDGDPSRDFAEPLPNSCQVGQCRGVRLPTSRKNVHTCANSGRAQRRTPLPTCLAFAVPAISKSTGARLSTSGTARRQDLHDLSDAQLCALLRERDSASGADLSDVMGEVFARHHDAVLAYARTCCRDLATAGDLAAEAFARTYRAVAWGTGPEYVWRPYLLTCVRRVAAEWARRGARTQLSDDFDAWAAGLTGDQDVEGAALSAEEGSLVLRAYRSLPERWQAVLWHAVVEDEPAAETARRLGISAGGVGSLAARAREGLREAYLRAHLDESASEECRHYGALLAAALRRPGKRVTRDLGRHLRACESCGRAERDLRAVNNRLGALLPAGILLWHPASFALTAGAHGAHH